MAECESLLEKGEGVNSGLPDLHLKGALLGELLTVSRNWLPRGGPIPPGSARPQMSEHQKMKDAVNTVLFPSDGRGAPAFYEAPRAYGLAAQAERASV